MQIEFSDEYMLAAVLLVLALVFCRPFADCVRCACTLCVVPHECSKLPQCVDALRDLLRGTVLGYCLLQPLWFWLGSRAAAIYTWAHANATDTALPHAYACVRSAEVVLNHTALRHDALELTPASGVVTVDALVVCMPFAVVSAITTAAWKHLVDVHVLNPGDTWSADLFDDDSKVWEYELLFLAEAALATLATLYTSAAGIGLATAVHATVAVCSFQVFFAVGARYEGKASAATCITSTLTVVFLLILLDLALRYIDRSSPARVACGVVGLAAQFAVAAGHQIAAGESSVATVLSLRALASFSVSVALLVLLALHAC